MDDDADAVISTRLVELVRRRLSSGRRHFVVARGAMPTPRAWTLLALVLALAFHADGGADALPIADHVSSIVTRAKEARAAAAPAVRAARDRVVARVANSTVVEAVGDLRAGMVSLSVKSAREDEEEEEEDGGSSAEGVTSDGHVISGRAHGVASFLSLAMCVSFSIWVASAFCRVRRREGDVLPTFELTSEGRRALRHPGTFD